MTEMLSDRLERLAGEARGPWLSLPGDPAWLIERDKKGSLADGISGLLHGNLPTIIAALRKDGK